MVLSPSAEAAGCIWSSSFCGSSFSSSSSLDSLSWLRPFLGGTGVLGRDLLSGFLLVVPGPHCLSPGLVSMAI